MQENASPSTLWTRVVDFLDRASRQRHIVALRDGMIGAVPVILVGSTFLLLGVQGGLLKEFFPGIAASPIGQWYLEMAPVILLPFRYTMGLLSLYVSFTIACALAKEYDLPQIPNGLTSVATFLVSGELITGKLVSVPEVDIETLTTARYLAADPLGAKGLFLAIIVSILCVELSRKLTFLPKDKDAPGTAGVPPAVVNAFASFLPMLVCVLVMWTIVHGLGWDLHGFIEEYGKGLKALGDSYPTVFVVNILLHLFGVAGVHGISVINAGMLPIWQEFLVANADAHELGKAMPYVTAYPFYQWFIWIGGAGATLAPTIRCMFSKNAHVKKIGRVAFIPGLFNINEPLLFGLPVVANPILGIPFIVAPLVCGTIAYFATTAGLVGRCFIEVPWVMPCFLGSVLSTQDRMAFVLLMVNLVVSYVIWAPFIGIYEKRLEAGTAVPKKDEKGGELPQGDTESGPPSPDK